MSTDSSDYRNTLGLFPTGVTVITTLDTAGREAGFTASSFNSVSLEPQLVLWSLDKSSSLIPVFESAERYAIHFLASSQIDISNTFASPANDRFANLDWSLSETQLPILKGCAAHLECESRHIYEGGDHLIFVGEVTQHFCDRNKKALVYHRGEYSECKPLG